MDFAPRNDRAFATMMAFAVHGLIFGAGALGLTRGIQYGIDGSNGMAEVDLVAAPAPDASAIQSQSGAVQAPPAPTETDEDGLQEPVTTIAPPAPAAVVPVPNALLTTKDLSGPLGDGSSPIAGKDATTIHRAGSSGAFFKPGYYRNPPPPYPEEARKLKQQGRVLLEVHVTSQGKVSDVRLKQSSGFPLLDASALKAVRTWKFRAATLAGLPIDILADIPIRFQLN